VDISGFVFDTHHKIINYLLESLLNKNGQI